jgi:hypothetical protein
MAGNPRTVTQDVIFTWDGVPARLAKGQVIDVTPGSKLEAAIGADKLVPRGSTSALPPAEQPGEKPAEEAAPKAEVAQGGGGGGATESSFKVSQPAPAKLPAVGAKKQDSAKDGDS